MSEHCIENSILGTHTMKKIHNINDNSFIRLDTNVQKPEPEKECLENADLEDDNTNQSCDKFPGKG